MVMAAGLECSSNFGGRRFCVHRKLPSCNMSCRVIMDVHWVAGASGLLVDESKDC